MKHLVREHNKWRYNSYFIVLLFFMLSVVMQGQYADYIHYNGGYLSGDKDSVVAIVPHYFQHISITVDDTTDSTPDSLTVWVRDRYFSRWSQVSVRKELGWTDGNYVIADSATVNRYLLLAPYPDRIQFKKDSTGSVIRWSIEAY